YSIPGHPGYFGISGLPSGTYTVTVEGAGEGSRYSQQGPSFNITLNQGGYSSPEGFSAEGGNADGFVDASSNTVILNAQNPSARLLGSDGKVMPSPSVSETVGSSNPFTYQLSSYLPFASSFSLSLSSPGYSLVPSSIKVAGIPLSTLEGHGASFASYTLSLNSSALSYIESKGFLPATSTSPGETSKILPSGGEENRVFSIAFSSYLNPSFKDGDEVSYSLKYPGQTITGNFPAASTSTTRASKSHAGSSASTLASTNPLWFRAVSEDGKPLTQITVEYQEELDSGDTGAQGTISLSSPAGDPGFFTFPYSFLPYAQGGNGLNVSVEEGGYYSFSSGQQYLSAFFYTAGNSGSDVQFFPFQYMTLQQAVYTAYGTHMSEFDGGLVDPATQTVVVGASNPSSQLLSSDGKVDSSSFPTAIVGEANPFTYQVDTFLSYPVNSTVPRLFPGCYGFDSYFNNCPDGSANGFPSGPPEVIQVMNGNGEEVLQDASDIEVAGIPLTQLESYGASVSYNDSYGAYDSQASGSAAALSLTLPSKALSFIASNGYLPATSSMPVGSSPLDGSRALSVTFKAYINPAQGKVAPPEWNVGEETGYGPSEGYAALASRSLRRSFGNFKGSDHKNGGGASLSLPEVYTNGPSDNSIPSSLSASDPSSATGLWFENTFEETFKKDTGCGGIPASYTPSEFTVQNPSGEYLTPVESDGAFEGWEWSGSPYDFKERNSSGTYEWGGLADGTYTLKSVEYPSLSFTGSLSYSSPEALTGKGEVSASWNLPDSGVVLSFDWQVSGGNL
ncbi:MAG: hypothetical protein J6O87_02910, partial [Aeriscardovia sp.]|nr:hypothetical protein [Aeriscardovia sp.]